MAIIDRNENKDLSDEESKSNLQDLMKRFGFKNKEERQMQKAEEQKEKTLGSLKKGLEKFSEQQRAERFEKQTVSSFVNPLLYNNNNQLQNEKRMRSQKLIKDPNLLLNIRRKLLEQYQTFGKDTDENIQKNVKSEFNRNESARFKKLRAFKEKVFSPGREQFAKDVRRGYPGEEETKNINVFGRSPSLIKRGPSRGEKYGPRMNSNKYSYYRTGIKAGRKKGISPGYRRYIEGLTGIKFSDLTPAERKQIMETEEFRYDKSNKKWQYKKIYKTPMKVKISFQKLAKGLQPKESQSAWMKQRQQKYQQQYQNYLSGAEEILNPALNASLDTNKSLDRYHRQLQSSYLQYMQNKSEHLRKVQLRDQMRKQLVANQKQANIISAPNMFSKDNPFMADHKGIDILQNTFAEDRNNNIMLPLLDGSSIDLFGYSKSHPNILSPQENHILDSKNNLKFF